MPEPPPEPPNPGWSPPVGDIASEPVFAVGGSPTLVPGWLETIVPASLPLPAVFGGVMLDPTSSGAPSPAPLRPIPAPVAFDPPPIDGGGGTTLLANSVP